MKNKNKKTIFVVFIIFWMIFYNLIIFSGDTLKSGMVVSLKFIPSHAESFSIIEIILIIFLNIIILALFSLSYKQLGKKKKAQAAMEFVINYGWAIVAVIVTVIALSFFIPMGDKLLQNVCTIGPGLDCEDYKVNESGYVLIKVKNGIGEDFEETSLTNIVLEEGACESLCWQPLQNGESANYFLRCTNSGKESGVFKANFHFSYKEEGKIITKSKGGKLITKIESGDLGGNLCDGDSDNLNDNKEHELGTNPQDKDSDNDKIEDGEEYDNSWNPLALEDPTCEEYGAAHSLSNSCYDNNCNQYDNCTDSSGYCNNEKYCCSGTCTQESFIQCGGYTRPFCPDFTDGSVKDPGPPPIYGDGDGVVNFEDLLYIGIGSGSSYDDPETRDTFISTYRADCNQDCTINQTDMDCFTAYYGQHLNCSTFTDTCPIGPS